MGGEHAVPPAQGLLQTCAPGSDVHSLPSASHRNAMKKKKKHETACFSLKGCFFAAQRTYFRVEKERPV